jgi:hypothetical protein
MAAPEKRALQRVRYAHGQMLRSVDFSDQLADTAQHRWWHNRAIHDAYGVYQGLDVTAIRSGGALTGVTVAAGAGVDCFGRELIVDSPQTVALPPNVPAPPVTMVLLVQYDEGHDGQPASLSEICWTSDTAPGGFTATFVWTTLDRVRVRDGVPLAHVIYDYAGHPRLKPGFVPPGARPIARPTIAAGATLPAKTPWQPWMLDVRRQIRTGQERVTVGVQTTIDTSASGFTATPCYFAWLAGPLRNPITGVLLPDMFTSLANESATGFTFRMWFPPPVLEIEVALAESRPTLISTPDEFFPFARQQKLYVQWMACEMPPALPYVPMRLRMLNQLLLPVLLKTAAPVVNVIR